MNALLAALGLAVLLFGGWGIGYLLIPGEKPISTMAVHAWLLGAIVVTITLGFFGTILSGRGLLALVAVACIIPGFAALRKIPRRGMFAFEWPRPAGWLEWTLLAVILCQCAVLLRYAWTTAIGWDGLVVWEIKARIAAYNGGSLPVDYFTDPTRSWSHPDYPLMLPLLETWIYMWMGQSSQFLVRIIYPVFYFAALLLLYSGAAEISGKRWVGLLAASLLFFVSLLATGQSNVFTGYADFPLAVLYLAAVASFIRYTRDAANSRAVLFAIYAGAMPWMKREGAILWLCFILVAGVELIGQRKIRVALLAVVPGLITIAGWKIAQFSVRAIPNHDFLPATAANVAAHLNRVGPILRAVIVELSSINDWSILWAVFPIALVLLAAKGRRTLSLQLGALVFMPLVLYASVYILSSWNPYQTHIDCSLPRLVSHLSLVALLTFAIALPDTGQ